MSDTTKTIGSTGIVKSLVEVKSGVYADAVVIAEPYRSSETVVAGAASPLGKLQAVAENGIVYVRASSADYRDIEWRVKCDKTHAVQLYKARSIVDSVTVTCASLADTETFTLNGLTFTAEDTAADAAWASRKFYTGGADDKADAAQLAALINADWALVPDGSVAVNDTFVVTADGTAYTYTAKATAAYPSRQFDQSGDQAAELASVVLAINHKDNVTLANVSVNDTVTINNGTASYTFTAKASETAASRQFSQNGTDTQDGDSLVSCVNDATYGVPGITAVNNSGVVSFTRSSAAYTCTVTSSNATRLKTEAAGGVPGVIAAATGATGELAITPTWAASLTVAAGTGAHITITDIDVPGVLATRADAVITLTPGTPGAPSGQELASTIYAQTGTAAAHIAVSQAGTLSGLAKHGAAVTAITANSTTAGALYDQEMNGWEYGYMAVTNTSGDASVATIVVGATTH